MELNNCDLVSTLTFEEPRLREDLVRTPLCHGKTNKLYCAPHFECFDTISHQRIPCDLYRLILQSMLVDKILRCNNTTRCSILEKVESNFRNEEDTAIDAY